MFNSDKVVNPMSFADLGGCAVQAGVVFIRRCGKPVEFECVECGLPLCGEHGRQPNAKLETPSARAEDTPFVSMGEGPPVVYCPTCLSRLEGTELSDSNTTGNWNSLFLSGSYHDWYNSPFTEEDYAAFDAVSEFDKDGGTGHGYDS